MDVPETLPMCRGGAYRSRRMMLQGCLPVDLLIHTSGETRLSDIMCSQVRNAQLVFANLLWPDFSFFDLLRALL